MAKKGQAAQASPCGNVFLFGRAVQRCRSQLCCT
jgi:hypothetical protein